VAAQKVFAAKFEGRDPAAEKRESKRRVVADRVEDLLENYITQRLSQNRSGEEIARLLRRETGRAWTARSIHEIGKRDVVELISAIEQLGAPAAANKTLKSIKTFLRWCVGRAILDQSPAEGVPLPTRKSLGIEFSMTKSSGKSSLRRGRWKAPTEASLKCWPLQGSVAKRSRV
jgi:Phage integrase central domain